MKYHLMRRQLRVPEIYDDQVADCCWKMDPTGELHIGHLSDSAEDDHFFCEDVYQPSRKTFCGRWVKLSEAYVPADICQRCNSVLANCVCTYV